VRQADKCCRGVLLFAGLALLFELGEADAAPPKGMLVAPSGAPLLHVPNPVSVPKPSVAAPHNGRGNTSATPKPHTSWKTPIVVQMRVSASVNFIKIVNQLAQRLLDSGDQDRCSTAELVTRRSLSTLEMLANAMRPEDPIARIPPQAVVGMAYCLSLRGQYGTAESMYRQTIVSQEGNRKASEVTQTNRIASAALSRLALLLDAQGRYAEAEPLYRRGLATAERADGPDSPEVAHGLKNLAVFLNEQHRYATAEPLLKRALTIVERTDGLDSAAVAAILSDYAAGLVGTGHYADAESLYRRAVSIVTRVLGPDKAPTATALSNLAFCLYLQQRYQEAEPLFLQALAIREAVLRPDHPDTLGLRENIARNYFGEHRFDLAVANYRISCSAYSSFGSGHDLSGDAAQAARLAENQCASNYSIALADWASQGGGRDPRDRPASLMLEAFIASQNAVRSSTSEAVARAATLTEAEAAGVGTEMEAYETAVRERDSLDLQFAKDQVSTGSNVALPADVKARETMRARDEVGARIRDLDQQIRDKAPRFWDYRMAEPISAPVLQAQSGPEAALLHPDEALITFLVPPGSGSGLVFALSKEKVAWARIGMTGEEVSQRVLRLRQELDPHSYRSPSSSRANYSFDADGRDPRAFDRQSAYELYDALLGDLSIQEVIGKKPNWLFITSGALSSLPPGVLITSPPEGGAQEDTDPQALRTTKWLLRSKAVALLPAVSSLRTLRQVMNDTRRVPTDALLAFADPEYLHRSNDAGATAATNGDHLFELQPVRASLRELLSRLPRLPGTRVEGEAVQHALGAEPAALLLGRDASKEQLMSRNEDGRLAKVRVLEFATHGLVAGDASDLAEPALVLATGERPTDSVLLASEAATLRLNADWVLLSACNTASPAAPGAEGFSGLTRAFFHAGAKSLLVSHWSVRDDVAPRLIPAMLLAEQNEHPVSRAQALREASLSILDDLALNAASPAAWAPFTLIGEAAY
jgi:CHAT domain-containing protein/tetratricopeptide (TPR) repeat protein